MRFLRAAKFSAAVSGAALLAGLMAAPVLAEDLNDAITLAYETNPTLQAQRASQRGTDEEYVQAEAGYRPTVSVTASITHDDNQARLASTLPAQPTNTSSAVLSVTQPLYTGGRVSSAVSAAEADILAGREGLRRVEISVVQSVIQSYLDVRRDQAQLAITTDNVNVLSRQLEETKARFDVGEVTRTDVAQAQARLSAGKAQMSSTEAALAVARGAYAAVVGQNPGELAAEPPISGLLPQSVEQAFDAAERNNPQLRQADYAEQASAARVAAAKAQTRPNVSARAALGYSGGGLSSTTFQPISAFDAYSRDISATVTATVPLFTGGLTSSQVRQAAERNNVDRIGIETARRQVLQAVSQAWNQLLGARANLLSNEEQVKAATIAYEGTRQEEQVGLRTTLDVLNAQQELENAEIALVSARHDEYLASAAVLAAMGALEAKNLVTGTQVYDPAVNASRVRHAIGWVPWEPVVSAMDHLGQPAIQQRPAPSPPGQIVKP